MAEETKKEMTPWRVERLQDGTLRCARNEIGNDKEVEAVRVPRPEFSPVEMAAVANLCIALGGDVRPIELSEFCYDARYNRNARRTLDALAAKGDAK